MLELQDLKFKGIGLFYTAEHCQLKMGQFQLTDFSSAEPGLRLSKKKRGTTSTDGCACILGQIHFKDCHIFTKR